LPNQPQELGVFDPVFYYGKKFLVGNAVKEFFNVAFQDINRLSIITANFKFANSIERLFKYKLKDGQ